MCFIVEVSATFAKHTCPMHPTSAIPGPRGREALQFLGFGSPDGMLAYFARLARTYGPIVSFRVFGQRIVLLDDADMIADVLQNQQQRFARDTGAVLLREIVGDGVLTTEDPVHLQRRRMLQPAFHRARISTYADAMVAESERTAQRWQAGETIDIGAEMTRLTLAVVGRSLFGSDVADEARGIARVIASIGSRGGRLQPLVAAIAPIFFALRRLLPQQARLIFGRERAQLEAIVDPIIARRRSDPGGDDLLAMLLEVRDDEGRALSDVDIRNELITFVLAGHETTSSALTWAWYAIGRNPHIERQLHAELDAVLGGRLPTLEDVRGLTYTARVFDEALRMFPPAAAFGRRPTEDVAIGGYRVPRGASVFVSPFVTHRNPRYFSDPDTFEPDRWAGAAPPKFAFFPFGGGSKMCIGEAFARAEGVLVLATLARRWRLRLCEDATVDPAPSALLRPARAIMAAAEPRLAGAISA
jgi:cytochrome P450